MSALSKAASGAPPLTILFLQYALIVLVAGLFSALALVGTNKLADTEPPVRILMYNFGFSTLLLIPLCIWAWKPLTARS